jgi:hypothetical protein
MFGVCSRNYQLLKPDGQSYWEVANRLQIKSRLIKICKEFKIESFVLQGEIIGSKIQNNKYNRKENDFYVFNLVIDGEVYDNITMLGWCSTYDFKTVPHYGYNHRIFPNINMMVKHATGKSDLADIPREGFVWRNYKKNISFKVINPEFLLKYDA